MFLAERFLYAVTLAICANICEPEDAHVIVSRVRADLEGLLTLDSGIMVSKLKSI